MPGIKFYKTAILAMTLCLILISIYAFAQSSHETGETSGSEMSYVTKHPVEVEVAVCSQCHPDKWADQDHVVNWDLLHKFSAARNMQICKVCHEESFCSDCHGNKEEIKPSDKYKQSPQRALPHRGDYLTQHKIDGKVNPAACFRCHGRQNNEKCRLCHK